MADVRPGDAIPTAAPEICIPIPTPAGWEVPNIDRLKQATHKLKDDDHDTKIHRFPTSLLREFCEERQYIAPKVVAMGPYYHGRPELKEMEEVKKAATYHFCTHLNKPLEVVYKEVVAIAGDARRCYDSSMLHDISDVEFASMMFYDACFLLVTMAAFTRSPLCDPLLQNRITTPMVARDIFLLENQIPWLVLQTLNIVTKVDLSLFLNMMVMGIQSRFDYQPKSWDIGSYMPPHLLGLCHFYQSGCTKERANLSNKCEPNLAQKHDHSTINPQSARVMIPHVKHFFSTIASICSCRYWQHDQAQQPRMLQSCSCALGTSAIELAEIGVKLTPSKTAEFNDIGVTENIIFPELFLPPLYLNQTTASWLLNMAAFEICTLKLNSDYSVNSYLSFLAALMDREEDVHELRAKQIIMGGTFSDQQMLKFFKGRLPPSFFSGQNYIRILLSLEEYKRRGRVWIPIHRFFYHNIRTIIKVISIVGVLVGISRIFFLFNQL